MNYVKLPTLIGTRVQIRSQLIDIFKNEIPGTGTGALVSKYEYEAANYPGHARILLRRPAIFNFGLDFTIHVEGKFFRDKGANRDAPSHADIVADLVQKRASNPTGYANLSSMISKEFSCTLSDAELLTAPQFSTSLTGLEVLLAIRWLFIEQDITYWNYSGRGKLYAHLSEIGLL